MKQPLHKTEKEIIRQFTEAARNVIALWDSFHVANEQRRKSYFAEKDIGKFVLLPPETSDVPCMTQLRRALAEAKKGNNILDSSISKSKIKKLGSPTDWEVL